MRPCEPTYRAWALAPRVTWFTLTSGRPCCHGASRFHIYKMKSEYLLGVSAGLRRHKHPEGSEPGRASSVVVDPAHMVRVTVFIPLLGPCGEEKGENALLRGFLDSMAATDLQLHSLVDAREVPGVLSVATWRFCGGLPSSASLARACNPPGGFCRWMVFSFLADTFP